MANEGLPATSQQQPAKRGEIEDVPLRTTRIFDSCIRRFTELLAYKAECNMRERGSLTPTDADVDDAYRELTRAVGPGPVPRALGDTMMVLGGVFVPLASISWLVTICGLLMVLAGVYVREFSKKWG